MTTPNHASDVDVLPLLLIEEHVGLKRGAYPECPVLDTRLVGMQQHRIALCNCDNNTRNLSRCEKRAVGFDECQGMVVNREADCRKGPRIDESDAISFVAFYGILWMCLFSLKSVV